MSKFLVNKKILFITTQFYGYEKAIINALKQSGAEVKVYFDDPVSYTRIKFLKNWISKGTRRKVNKFYRSYLLKKTANKEFDFIFLLKGAIMSHPFLETMRKNHPNAVLMQYQWDSLENFNYEQFIKHFDFSFTFDNADAIRVPALEGAGDWQVDREPLRAGAHRRERPDHQLPHARGQLAGRRSRCWMTRRSRGRRSSPTAR